MIMDTRRTRLGLVLVTSLALLWLLATLWWHLAGDGFNLPQPSPAKSGVTVSEDGVENHQSVPAPLLSRRVPDAVIAGVSKCGTRALIDMLDTHSEVAIAEGEPGYYLNGRMKKKGLDWYLKKMPLARPDQLVMEKTPKYFITPGAPLAMLTTNPNTKVILIFRDPVVRVMSRYIMLKAEQNEERPLKDVVIDSEGQLRTNQEIIFAGMYSKYLKAWQRLFPPEQLLVLDGDNLLVRPWEELEKAERFLGLPVTLTKDKFIPNAHLGKFFCWHDDSAEGGDDLHCLGKSKGREHEDMSATLNKTLTDFYRPYNQELVTMLEREFLWTNN